MFRAANLFDRIADDAVTPHIGQGISDYRGWYIFQGAAFLFFGFLAAILPGVTAISATLLISALLLITGSLQLIASFKSRMHWWSFLSALLSIAVGGWILWIPLSGILALVMMVAIFFTVEGAVEILLAFEFLHMHNWGWMLVSGIATLALSALLWIGFPGLSPLYLGLLIAINFIFYGFSLLMLAARAPQ